MVDSNAELERLRAENEQLRANLTNPEPAIPYEEDPRFAAGAVAQTKRAVDLAQLQLDGLADKRAKVEKQLDGIDKSTKDAEKTHAAAVKDYEKWAKVSEKLGNPAEDTSNGASAQAQSADGSGEALGI